MHDALQQMLARYQRQSSGDHVHALREIIQEIALLGLWRAKFFEHAAFYGGTALRIFHNLDRFSEDLDFTLLEPQAGFSLEKYASFLENELDSFGFEVSFEKKHKQKTSAIESAFLKTGTAAGIVAISPNSPPLPGLHPEQLLKIKLEVDTDPPGGFLTETRYLLQPFPFAVRLCKLPDLFAGKMHALLFRNWKNRVKGRDWYDFVWYASNHPQINLTHLEARMRQSGDWQGNAPLDLDMLRQLLRARIATVDFRQAAGDVAPFLNRPEAVQVWSEDFFVQLMPRIQV